jgi:hypothetical protein
MKLGLTGAWCGLAVAAAGVVLTKPFRPKLSGVRFSNWMGGGGGCGGNRGGRPLGLMFGMAQVNK